MRILYMLLDNSGAYRAGYAAGRIIGIIVIAALFIYLLSRVIRR